MLTDKPTPVNPVFNGYTANWDLLGCNDEMHQCIKEFDVETSLPQILDEILQSKERVNGGILSVRIEVRVIYPDPVIPRELTECQPMAAKQAVGPSGPPPNRRRIDGLR